MDFSRKPLFSLIHELPPPPHQAIDKRNQNIIRSVLESAPPVNVSHAEEKVGWWKVGLMFTFLPALYFLAVRFISAARFLAAESDRPAKYLAGTPNL